MLTKRASLKLATALAALMVVGSAEAAEKLRLLTWSGYAPADVVAAVHEGDRHRGRGDDRRTTRR